MSEIQKQRRAKRLLSMAEEAREKARAELAQKNQQLQSAADERERVERKLLEDHRGAGRSADWMLAELDQENSRRELKKAQDLEGHAQQAVGEAEKKASAAHQKHRAFERFHDNIASRIETSTRRKENLEADAFALVMWSKKNTDGDGEL
jgi:hypothetical protein